MGSCHSLHLRHANSAGLYNNFSDCSSEDDFLEQCHTYCFQAPSTSSLPLIWACAQKSALYVLSPALAVTWSVDKQKCSEILWKCCSCSLHPDMASLITLPHCRLHSFTDHLSVCYFTQRLEFLFEQPFTSPTLQSLSLCLLALPLSCLAPCVWMTAPHGWFSWFSVHWFWSK